jgi:hypothetical protein
MQVFRNHLAFIACTFLLVGCKAVSAPKQISFENLEKNESIQVQFNSRGCFHHTAFLLLVEKDPSGFNRLATYNQSGERLDPIALDRVDLKYLNLLMEWYRHNHGGSCTTVDTITVSKHREGLKIAEEHFTDESCELGSRIDMPTFSTYWERAGGK